jgi:hypothetical protein
VAVFVINDGGARNAASKDLSDAQRFGEIVLVSRKHVYPQDVNDDGRIVGQIFSDLEDAANRFNPRLDYLLPIGDMVQVLQFVALVVSMQKELPIRTLRYDKHENGYYVVKLMQKVVVTV